MIKAKPLERGKRKTPTAGHNSGPVIADRLRSFIERIERVIEEREALNGDIRDIYSEAKGVGYDIKTMRKVVALRKMDEADRAEQETLLNVYCHALGMVDRIEARAAAGESTRQIAKAEGVSKSTAHRVSQKAAPQNDTVENGADDRQPDRDLATVAGDETVTPAAPASDTAQDDMMAAAARLDELKREKGFAV